MGFFTEDGISKAKATLLKTCDQRILGDKERLWDGPARSEREAHVSDIIQGLLNLDQNGTESTIYIYMPCTWVISQGLDLRNLIHSRPSKQTRRWIYRTTNLNGSPYLLNVCRPRILMRRQHMQILKRETLV